MGSSPNLSNMAVLVWPEDNLKDGGKNMQNKKKLGLVLCLVALLVVGALCLSACTKKDSRSFVTFEGVEEIHAPVGTVTEESLLAGVTAVDANGKKKDVTVDLGGADLSKSGRYLIEYKAGDSIKREAVYLYGDISFQINGQNLEGDRLEIDFATAINSLHFAKIASAKDSFGKEITATLVDGDKFAYATGEYTAKYTATDKAGQTVEKTVTYTVTSDIEMTVQSGVSVKYEQDSVTFKVNLDGEKDVWLMANGGLVSIADYTVTETGLVLKSSYFRTLAPGENALKLCSVNGSTDFAFTVVDTGKPLFTFDSIYKSNIIAGSPVVYKMPKAQIAGHEYSYSFKVTKNGVAYKAEQKGNNLLITTTSGKNADAGMYEITVTATNKADTSKKTTIKRDFRVYTNQAEIDGWKFGNDGNGSQLVNVDLSEEGYYRTAWEYKAKSPNSWNGRVFWQKVTKATFQTVTFDFKITSLGVAEKENGPVKFVGKNGKAEIPFHTSTMSGEGVARIFYDMNGNVVAQEELKMNTWYTVKMDVSEILHPKSESTDLAWYFGVSNKWQATMLITEMHFWAYEGSGTQHVFKDEAKTVSLERNGGKSSLVSGKLDDESIISYSVTDKHIPGTAIKRALKVNLLDTSKEVVSIDFKYLEEVKDVSGNVLDLSMYVHDVELRNDGVFGANYAIVDAETGEPTVKMEVGKWYTLYITTHGRKTYTIYPMGKKDTQLTCKMAFKNLQTYDVDMPGALLLSDSGNIAPSGMYKMPDGEWGISYASYSGWDATPNTAYYRRIIAKLSSDTCSEIRFQFRYTVSDFLEKESTEFVQNFNLLAPNITVVDDNFNAVPVEERQLGVWYTAVIASSDGSPLAKSFEMYPQGYNDGGKDDQIVNVELQFRNIVASETKPIPVHTNDDNTVSLQAASGKSDLSAGVDAEAGMLVYTNTAVQMPSAPDSRALLLKVLAEGKGIAKFSFKFESATAPDGTPLAPDMYVADEQRGGYWRRAESAITDESGKPVANLEVGKWYTMWITTEGQSEFRVYPMGMIGDQQVLCKMLVKDMETAEVEIGGAHFISNDGGTFGSMGLYKNGEEKWEYFSSAYDRYSSWIPGYNGKPKNLADYRKIRLTLDSADYVVASFEFQYQVSRYIKLEEGAEWTNNLALISGASGHILTVLDADGNEVAAANRQIGVWYTAIIKKNDGTALNQSIPMYTCGYSGTNEGQSVEMELLLRNPKAAKGNSVHTNADNTISIQSAGMVDALTAEEGSIRYKMDKATAATTNMTDRAISVKRLAGNTKGLIKMELVLNAAKDQNDQNVEPWVVVENANGWNSYVLTDKDGNAVKQLKADGNSYFLYITTKDTKADNNAFTFYPVGRGGEQIYADMLIKNIEAIEVEAPVATFTVPDGQSYMNVGIYADEDGQHISMQSYQKLHEKNTAWRRRVAMTLNSDQYTALFFQIRYMESKFNGETKRMFNADGYTVTYYDADNNEVAQADLQDGVWYNAILTKNGGGALPASGYTFYTVTTADGDGEYNAGKYVELAMQIRNIKGGIAKYNVAFDLNYAGATNAPAKIEVEKGQSYGELPVPERDGYTFIGWYTDAACTGEAVVGTTEVTASHTLYAKWARTEVPVVEFATPGTLADPVMSIVDGKIVYTITGSTTDKVAGAQRKLTVTALNGETTEISFEFKLSNLDGATANISNPDAVLSIKFYDAEGTEVTALTADAWHKMVVTKADGTAFGTSAWEVGYLGGKGKGSGSLDVEIRNVKVAPDANAKAEVSFDLNYAGATGAPESMQVTEGNAYGTLPTPTREGYTFGGWYTDAACSGEAVTAETLVTSSHTLYAKWTKNTTEEPAPEVDTSPVVVQDNAEYNPNNAKLTHSIVEGKHVYTYTTKGVASPTTNPWGRRVNIKFTAGAQTHVAVEFRFTEAKTANGTDFAPSLGVYSHNEGNGGSWISTIDFYDSTGKRIKGNETAALTVGEWYTVVVGVKSATDYVELWTAHNYTTDAAILTMEIRDRSTYVSNGLIPKTVTSENFGAASLLWTEADGWHYYIADTGKDISAWSRRTDMTVPEAMQGYYYLSYEVKINSYRGVTNRIRVSTGKNIYYDLETGEFISDAESTTYLEVGKWYKIIHITNDKVAMGASYRFAYPGDSGATGNISVSFRNFDAFDVDTSNVAIAARDANNLNVVYNGKNTYNMTTVGVKSAGTEAWQWAALATAPDNTHTKMYVNFKFNFAYASDGTTAIDPTMTVWRGTSAGSGVSMEILDMETGAKVDSGNNKKALELGKWYTLVITNPSGDLQTTYRLTPCYSYAGAAKFSIDIADHYVTTE